MRRKGVPLLLESCAQGLRENGWEGHQLPQGPLAAQQTLAWPLLSTQSEAAGLPVCLWLCPRDEDNAKEKHVMPLGSDASAGSAKGTHPYSLGEN